MKGGLIKQTTRKNKWMKWMNEWIGSVFIMKKLIFQIGFSFSFFNEKIYELVPEKQFSSKKYEIFSVFKWKIFN